MATFRKPIFELVDKLEKHDEIQTAVQLLEFNSKHNPSSLFCLQATATHDDRVSGLREISMADMYFAIKSTASHLSTLLQPSKPHRNAAGEIKRPGPVAILLASDVGLLMHLLGLVYLGVPVVLLSARLSAVAIAHLLEKTGAQDIIVSARARGTVDEARDFLSSELRIHSQTPYEEFLVPKKGDVVERCDLVEETDRNVLILHSSGTTGLPKPIYHGHKYLLGYAGCHLLPDEGVVRRTNLSTLPLYHGFGLLAPMIALSTGMPFCLPAATTIPTAELVIQLLQRSEAKSLMTVPSILEDLGRGEEGVAALRPLDFIAVGGGPIKPSVGEHLASKGIRLLNHAGATEIGAIAPIFCPGPEYDWHYLVLRKDIGLQLELVPTTEGPEHHRLVGFPFGWGERFEVQDLLECNPLHPEEQFKILGRNDDLIVLANGEKVLPRVLESAVAALEEVKSVVVFGEGRFELGVIVEPVGEMREGFVERVWEAVGEANETMDEHARVTSKEMVVVADRAVPRSDKGSCMRKETYRVFEEEIEEAYRRLERSSSSVLQLKEENLTAGLTELVRRCIRAEDIGADDDFFELGMDSLQAIRLYRLLVASTGSLPSIQGKELPRDIIFRFTTINKLTSYLRNSSTHSEFNRAMQMLSFAKQFAFTPRRPSVILLTGSTGSLGTFLVQHLTTLPQVTKIICLLRPSTTSTPLARQEQAFKSRGITLSPSSWSKLEILATDSKSQFLGLSPSVYESLTSSITHIVHNAWPMDFNRTLPSFEPHFHALQNLLQLATDIHNLRGIRPRIIFTSSIAAVGMYPRINNTPLIPETPMDDPLVTDSFGYAEAKWVCEKMLEKAGREFPEVLETCVVRVGQLTGSESSAVWTINEHFPALVKSSQVIGRLPEIPGTLSWLPVDWAAKALGEMLFAAEWSGTYHLENPTRQEWSNILDVLVEKLGLKEERVPFDEWLEVVRGNEDEGNVARKLTAFFEEEFLRMATGEVVLGTEKARGVSKTLDGCGEVPRGIVEKYVDAWRGVGFLS